MCRYAVVFLVGLVFVIQGCVNGVGWLPDSSGFAFTTPMGDLITYDIATKKQRVLLHDRAVATTCWPAIGPSGKRIALAHLQNSDDKQQAILQIEVCDMQGAIEFQSDKFKFASFTGTGLRYSTRLVWSPDEKKLLLHGHGFPNGGTGFACTALFDLTSGKLKVWDNHVPAYFGDSPVRPDGKGFLLAKVTGDCVLGYRWVEWNGRMMDITGPNGKEDDAKRIPTWSEGVPIPTSLFDSRWDGTKAILAFWNPQRVMQRFVIDTQELLVTVEDVTEADSKIGKELVQKQVVLASGVELLLLVQPDKNLPGSGIRVVARTKGDSALTEIVAPDLDQMILLNLSPDCKHAILRVSYGHRGSKADTIFVINNSGHLHDTITVVQRGGPSAYFEEK